MEAPGRLALALHGRWTGATLVALVLALVADAAAGGALIEGPAPLVAIVLLSVAVGSRRERRSSLVALVVAATGLTLANQLDASTGFSAVNDLAFFALATGAPMVLGDVLGRRSAEIAELRRRTAQLADAQDVAVAAARAEERARLAREVHAAVAQRVGELALQAAGAERVADVDGARALEALAHIEAGARSSLDELRDLIGVLRAPGSR